MLGMETTFFSPFASRITTTLFGSIRVLPVDLYSSGDVNLLPSSTLVSCECLGSSRLTALKAPHASRHTVIKKIRASVSLRPSPEPVAETFGPAAGRLFTSSAEVLFSFWFIFFPLQVVGLFGPSALHVFNRRTGLGGQDFFTETFVVDTDNSIPVSQPELPGCFFND